MNDVAKARVRGFMLVEYAVVLILAGLMATGAMAVISDAQQTYRRQAAKAALEKVRAAIQDFALRNKRLPCPDPLQNGLEGGVASTGTGDAVTCPATLRVGFVPFAALGIDEVRIDGKRRIRYGVWRSTSADLVKPTVADISRFDDPDGAKIWQEVLATALQASLDPAQPYLPGLQANSRKPDCTAPLGNPAFVLAPESSGGDPDLCFGSDPDGHADAVGMDSRELLGSSLQSNEGKS